MKDLTLEQARSEIMIYFTDPDRIIHYAEDVAAILARIKCPVCEKIMAMKLLVVNRAYDDPLLATDLDTSGGYNKCLNKVQSLIKESK